MKYLYCILWYYSVPDWLCHSWSLRSLQINGIKTFFKCWVFPSMLFSCLSCTKYTVVFMSLFCEKPYALRSERLTVSHTYFLSSPISIMCPSMWLCSLAPYKILSPVRRFIPNLLCLSMLLWFCLGCMCINVFLYSTGKKMGWLLPGNNCFW